MKLSELSGEAFDPDPEILGLTADSREVEKGFLFAALPGTEMDGARFIPQAEEKGAAAVLGAPTVTAGVPIVRDAAPRHRLAVMASRFYAGQPAVIAGVTGTNGKTSTARFAAQLWSMLGEQAGSIGTLGAEAPGFSVKLQHTTPEPVTLHKTLSAMAQSGATHLAMEISSHAIEQSRADGVAFSIAAFTNITQDHLDFHAGFTDYFNAKKRLFSDLLPQDGVAVVNADGEGAEGVCDLLVKRGVKTLTTGAKGETLKLTSCEPHPGGLKLAVETNSDEISVDLPLIGGFQAENALLAAGVVAASDFDLKGVIPLLRNLSGAPGRMEHVADANSGAVYVDYAHTPDAIETAIAAIRPHTDGRLIIILGAGGDRDKEKRPLMGKAASGADVVIVTDDNPRNEDPAEIRAQVSSGVKEATEIGDRAEAIAHGVALLAPGDVLLIAGKGHETGQTVGGQTVAFNDGDVARAEADRLKRGGA